MPCYIPIYLTGSKSEEKILEGSIRLLEDHFYPSEDKNIPIYVRNLGDIIEVRPAEGAISFLKVNKKGKSGKVANLIVSSDGEDSIVLRLNSTSYRIYYEMDKNMPSA